MASPNSRLGVLVARYVYPKAAPPQPNPLFLWDLPKTAGQSRRRCSTGVAALKARQEYSPGQRPGNKVFPGIPSPEGALQTHRNPCVDTRLYPSVLSPLQGFHSIGDLFPGRCPGLYYRCPFRASRSPCKRSVAHSETPHVFWKVPSPAGRGLG